MTTHSPDDDDEPRELVRADARIDGSGAELLARVVEQSNREAAASRAQARELVKALQGVQRSQEYLGEALQKERGRSRLLLFLVVLAPAVAVAGAWYVWRQVDAVKSDVDTRLERIVAEQAAAQTDAATKQHESRVAELAGDLDAVRRDLDASRTALADERKRVSDREAALAAVEAKGESSKGEVAALDYEVKAARSKANAEQQRANQLEERVQQLQKDLAARAAAPPPPAVAAAPAEPKVVADARPSETKPAEARPAPPPATSAETEKTRTLLNSLLKDTGDSVRYQFETLTGVAGRQLAGVRVVGVDETGAVVRTIHAARAEIVVDQSSGSVVLRFMDGRLVVGKVEAPFFDGSYGLVVRGDAAKWKATGLATVRD